MPFPQFVPDHVGAGGTQLEDRLLGRNPHHGEIAARTLVEGHGDQDWKTGGLLGGLDSQRRFFHGGHGFGQDRIGAPLGQSRRLLGESVEHFPFGDLAQRLDELSGGANGTDDVAVFAGAFACELGRQSVETVKLVAIAVFLEHEAVAAEGVGEHHLRSRLGVGGGHAPHDVGMLGVERFGATARLQTVHLEVGSGGPIRDDGVLLGPNGSTAAAGA